MHRRERALLDESDMQRHRAPLPPKEIKGIFNTTIVCASEAASPLIEGGRRGEQKSASGHKRIGGGLEFR